MIAHALAASGKLRAFLIHLGASAAVVGSVGALMLLLWFPPPWFMNDGFAFVPVVCRSEVIMLVFDRKSHAIVDWLE